MEKSRVQSILFDKTKSTLRSARAFLKRNEFKDKGVDEKEETYRFRQYNPTYLRRLGFTEYRTLMVDPAKNIRFVLAYRPEMMERRSGEIRGGLIMEPSNY